MRPAPPQSSESVAVPGSMTATVNSDEWIAGGSPPETKIEDVAASVDPNTGMITISGRRYVYHSLKADYMEEIAITLKQLQEGEYKLAPDFNNFQTATYTKGLDNPVTYFIQATQGGIAKITRIDTAEHRVFGSFEFSCKNAKGQVVDVTGGTFDNVHYQ